MTSNSNRSEQVVEGYKRDKLATSALREIHRLLREFEKAREDDKRIAVIGVILVVVLVAAAFVYLGSTAETITLS